MVEFGRQLVCSLVQPALRSGCVGKSFVPKDVKIFPVLQPYYKGRFSNGPSWPEIAAPQLGQELENLATGTCLCLRSGNVSCFVSTFLLFLY